MRCRQRLLRKALTSRLWSIKVMPIIILVSSVSGLSVILSVSFKGTLLPQMAEKINHNKKMWQHSQKQIYLISNFSQVYTLLQLSVHLNTLGLNLFPHLVYIYVIITTQTPDIMRQFYFGNIIIGGNCSLCSEAPKLWKDLML